MAYKWRPSASQKRAFAQRMQDPKEQQAYNQRKEAKAAKRRAGSQFDYTSAGGYYTPTKEQYNFCFSHIYLAESPEQKDAFNQVISGYTCNEKIHHDYIHIVNELRRAYIATL